MRHNLFNKALKVLLATNALILLAGAMLGPIYALFVEEIGGDLMDASIAGALFALSAGVVTLLSGHMSDKVRNSDKILILGYILMAAGFYSLQHIETVQALFVVQVIIGMGEAIYSPAFDKLYSMHLDHSKAGFQWAAWESMYYFTSAIGAFVGGLVVTQFGFDILFIIMAALCLLSGIYLYLISPKRVL